MVNAFLSTPEDGGEDDDEDKEPSKYVKRVAERLKNLSQRHAVVKTGPERWTEIVIPTAREPHAGFTDLLTGV